MASAAGGQSGGGSSLPRLEFYDFFTSQFWQVAPLGPQGIQQDSRAPQLLFYQFRFVGIQNLEAPLAAGVDSVLGGLLGGVSSMISGIGSSLSSAVGSYSPTLAAPAVDDGTV